MDKEPMTVDGYRQMQEEVKKLRSIERPAVVKAISEAREHGDISEKRGVSRREGNARASSKHVSPILKTRSVAPR